MATRQIHYRDVVIFIFFKKKNLQAFLIHELSTGATLQFIVSWSLLQLNKKYV